MKLHISVGRVSEMILMLSAIRKYGSSHVSDLFQLSIIYGINKEEALHFAKQCRLLTVSNGLISFTHDGELALGAFRDGQLSFEAWTLILRNFILYSRPSWAQLIPIGRREAYIFMSNDEKRCFYESGLMDKPTRSIVCWWDSISTELRKDINSSLLRIGREGEELTICYERTRTQKEPLWQSIESNKSGFDIQSVVDMTNDTPIFIESKNSTQRIDDAEFIITRNEWKIASHSNCHSIHLFYLWRTYGNEPALAIITPTDLLPHIPIEEGCGKWESISIPYLVFKDRFFKITTV